MTAVLTPMLALAYVRELSTDVRAAVVLDAAGAPLAGDAALAEPARRLLAVPEAGAEDARSAPHGDGRLLVVGAPGGSAIAVVAGPQALVPLLAHDLRAALAACAPAASP
jgi:hypothetical protein